MSDSPWLHSGRPAFLRSRRCQHKEILIQDRKTTQLRTGSSTVPFESFFSSPPIPFRVVAGTDIRYDLGGSDCCGTEGFKLPDEVPSKAVGKITEAQWATVKEEVEKAAVKNFFTDTMVRSFSMPFIFLKSLSKASR